jgi:hypothetical protein
MKDSAQIKKAVLTAVKTKKVICDLERTIQMNPTTKGATWRQVALCYKNPEMMKSANNTLAGGNSLGGVYGLPVAAILDVEYSENAKTSKFDKVISLSLK